MDKLNRHVRLQYCYVNQPPSTIPTTSVLRDLGASNYAKHDRGHNNDNKSSTSISPYTHSSQHFYLTAWPTAPRTNNICCRRTSGEHVQGAPCKEQRRPCGGKGGGEGGEGGDHDRTDGGKERKQRTKLQER